MERRLAWSTSTPAKKVEALINILSRTEPFSKKANMCPDLAQLDAFGFELGLH